MRHSRPASGNRLFKALCGTVAFVVGQHAAFADLTVGSPNVATADPLIPAPYTTPCVVTLFENQQFADFSAKPFHFAPPADCPGPWQKVVLSADYYVTMGRQFDRTAEIWLGGANIYFGTTQEPSATVSPSWHIERDLTDYSALFAAEHGGQAVLGNVVDDTYTGVIVGSATLSFYPLAPTVPDHPPRPDILLPLSASADGSTADLVSADNQLGVTFLALPQNIERVFLDVFAQSQHNDEFWYFNLPDDIADTFFDGGHTAFREVQISVDGHLAGIAPVYPWIYTGGADPLLWRPIPGVQTLSFEPYRVDLTPFAGVLSDGQSHSIALSVFNAADYFSTTANLLLYLDHGSQVVSGAVTLNTLGPAQPVVNEDVSGDDSSASGSVSVTNQHQFAIEGTLQTSHGTVTTRIEQNIAFSNISQLAISDTLYKQDTTQTTTIDSTTTRTSGATVAIVHEQRSYPLTFNYDDTFANDGSEILASSVDQEFKQRIDVSNQSFEMRSAQRDDHVVTSATRYFDADGNTTDLQSDASQTYTYSGLDGACYSRQITAQRRGLTTPGALTGITDGQGCPDTGNNLSFFDVFYNYASSVFGATVQLLP
jgi:hypothetical protein